MFVYKNYTQEALDRQYNNRQAVPDFAAIVAQWEADSEAFRQRARSHQESAYGPHPRETLDIFPAAQAGAPIQVFFHGGYWQAMDKRVFHFIAEGFIDWGATMIFINYPLAPQATMDEIIQSCRQAIVWLVRHGADYGANIDRLYISGHSAGGHIAAMLMTTAWPELDPTLPADPIKGACAISGLFNLTPIQLCYLNSVLGLDEAMTRRNSPVGLNPTCPNPLIVTVGEREPAEYQAQSQDLASAWSDKGLPITQIQAANADHFSILEQVIDPEARLNQVILQQMGLNQLTINNE
jgi:arylformamidase